MRRFIRVVYFSFLFTILAYIGIIFLTELYFYLNKKTVEKLISEALLLEKVKLNTVLILPPFYIRVNNANFSINRTSLELRGVNIIINLSKSKDSFQINYNMNIKKAIFTSPFSTASTYLEMLLKKYANIEFPPYLKTSIRINEILLKLNFLERLLLNIQISNQLNLASYEKLSSEGRGHTELIINDRIKLADADFKYNGIIFITNGIYLKNILSAIEIFKLDVGGIYLIKNHYFEVSASNIMEFQNEFLNNFFAIEDLRDVLILKRKDNPQLLEYLFPEGTYSISLNKKKKGFSFEITDHTRNFLNLNFYNNSPRKLDFSISTAFLKKINGDFLFNNEIKGNLTFDFNYKEINTKGLVYLRYDLKNLELILDNFYVGDLNFGRIGTLIKPNLNTVELTLPRGLSSGILGSIKDNNGKLKFILSAVSIRNLLDIKINSILDIDLTLTPLIVNGITLTGVARSERLNSEVLAVKMKYINDSIVLDKLSVLDDSFNLNGFINIKKINELYTARINGNLLINRRVKIPVEGDLRLNPIEETIDGEILADKKIKISLTNTIRESTLFHLETLNYSLKKYNLPGSIDIMLSLNLNNSLKKEEERFPILNSFSLSSEYKTDYGRFRLLTKGNLDKDKKRVEIPIFAFESSDDKLLGKGDIVKNENSIRAVVRFVREGKIEFLLEKDGFFGMINVNKFLLNLPLIERKAYLNTRFYISRKWNDKPEFYGSLSITDSEDSSSYYFNIPSFVIGKDEELNIINASLSYNLLKSKFSAKYKRGGFLNAYGTLFLENYLKFNYSVDNYYKTGQEQTFFYKISELKLGTLLDDVTISGKVIKSNTRLMFYTDREMGLSGFFNFPSGEKNWSLNFTVPSILASFNGNLKENGNLNGDISLILPLQLIGEIYKQKEIKGVSTLRLSISRENEIFDINGNLSISNVFLSFPYLKTRLTNFNATFPISNSYVLIRSRFFPTTTGNFVGEGFINIKDLSNPEINFRILPVSSNSSILVNYNQGSLSTSGKIFPRDMAISGNKSRINLSGNFLLQDFSVNIPLNLFLRSSETGFKKNTIYDMVNCDLTLEIGKNNKFFTSFNQFILKPGGKLKIYGPLSYENLKVKGEIEIEKGDLRYLARDFSIKEGYARFEGDDIIPYAKILAWYRYKDINKENVDIYLTFEGKATKIMLKDFYSIPERSKEEVANMIGIKSENISSVRRIEPSTYVRTGVDLAENLFFFAPLSLEVRRRLGLDLFAFRSTILQNYFSIGGISQTNVDFRNYISGSGLLIGKYLLPNLFVEYDVYFEKDPYSRYGLIPLHTLQLELNLQYFDIGWKYQPYNVGKEKTIYEQVLEFKFMRKF